MDLEKFMQDNKAQILKELEPPLVLDATNFNCWLNQFREPKSVRGAKRGPMATYIGKNKETGEHVYLHSTQLKEAGFDGSRVSAVANKTAMVQKRSTKKYFYYPKHHKGFTWKKVNDD